MRTKGKKQNKLKPFFKVRFGDKIYIAEKDFRDDVALEVAVVTVWTDKAATERHARVLAAAPDMFNAIMRLLACPELNLDDMEDETFSAIKEAREALPRLEAA